LTRACESEKKENKHLSWSISVTRNTDVTERLPNWNGDVTVVPSSSFTYKHEPMRYQYYSKVLWRATRLLHSHRGLCFKHYVFTESETENKPWE